MSSSVTRPSFRPMPISANASGLHSATMQNGDPDFHAIGRVKSITWNNEATL